MWSINKCSFILIIVFTNVMLIRSIVWIPIVLFQILFRIIWSIKKSIVFSFECDTFCKDLWDVYAWRHIFIMVNMTSSQITSTIDWLALHVTTNFVWKIYSFIIYNFLVETSFDFLLSNASPVDNYPIKLPL